MEFHVNSPDNTDSFGKRVKLIFGIWITLIAVQAIIGIYVAYHFISKWW